MYKRKATAGLSVLAAMAVGLGACGGGGTTRTATNTAAVAPLSTPAPTVAVSAGARAGAALPAPAPIQPAATPAHPTIPATTAKKAVVLPPTAPNAASAPVPLPIVPAPTTPALSARRQPTAAEVNQVISGVHALIPLFTPTVAQILQSGDQVCTAFDQGKTAAQIKATAMQMAGPYALLVPAATADSAVRTVVTLFCPGYLPKLG